MPAPPPLPPRALAGKASPKPRGNILRSSGPPTRVTKAPRGSKSQLRVEIPPSSNRYHSSLTTGQDLQSTKRCQEEVDWEAEHHDCLMYLEQADAEARKLKEEINNTKSEDSQLMQQLRGENTQATANLRRITSDHAKTQLKCSDLAEEIAQLKQQLETTVLTSQNQVAWGDIQPVLRETHTNLLSAAHGIWSTMESLRNKQLATFLPGPGVYRAPWVDEIAPLDVLGSSAAQPDQYPSLA